MKRLIICLCFIINMVMSGGIIAQSSDTKVEKSTENPLPPNGTEANNMNKWRNTIEPFIGVWSLERTILDAEGAKKDICPGTFMVINSNAAYTIFVYTDGGAIITSQGVILVDSSDEYIEVISQHVNKSLIGKSNRIDYKLGPNYLNKSFWIEKDKYGEDYNRQVDETWKRAKIPAEGEFRNDPAFPI